MMTQFPSLPGATEYLQIDLIDTLDPGQQGVFDLPTVSFRLKWADATTADLMVVATHLRVPLPFSLIGKSETEARLIVAELVVAELLKFPCQ